MLASAKVDYDTLRLGLEQVEEGEDPFFERLKEWVARVPTELFKSKEVAEEGTAKGGKEGG